MKQGLLGVEKQATMDVKGIHTENQGNSVELTNFFGQWLTFVCLAYFSQV